MAAAQPLRRLDVGHPLGAPALLEAHEAWSLMGTFSFVGLPVLLHKARASVIQTVTESAEDLVGESQDRTPVDTGTLRAGEHVAEITTTATSATARVATGGESNEYAIYVHEGTTRMSARPFMSQALLDNKAVYVEALRRAVSRNF